jgi:DNA-binding transcriptional ArsR family regulator
LDNRNSELARESEIHGTTLRVYWYLFKSPGPVGVRETQRALSMSSPSIALYHLEKLRELGVVDKNAGGDYSLKEQVQIGSLKAFLKVGRLILPRYLFYAIFLSTAVIVYSVEAFLQTGTVETAAVVLGAAGAGISWYECLRMWKDRVL